MLAAGQWLVVTCLFFVGLVLLAFPDYPGVARPRERGGRLTAPGLVLIPCTLVGVGGAAGGLRGAGAAEGGLGGLGGGDRREASRGGSSGSDGADPGPITVRDCTQFKNKHTISSHHMV